MRFRSLIVRLRLPVLAAAGDGLSDEVAVLEHGQQLTLLHVIAAIDEEPADRRADLRHDVRLIARVQNRVGGHDLADASAERWAGFVAGLLLLQYAPPSRLRLGVGQRFGMVEQSQEYQLAMPVLCPAALLLRRRLSARKRAWCIGRHISCLRKLAAPGVVASLRVHIAQRRCGGGLSLRTALLRFDRW